MLFSAVSCGQNRRPALHPGDLLFQAGKTSEMTGAITAATGEDAAAEFLARGNRRSLATGADSVLEATSDGGVRLTALAEFPRPLGKNRRTAGGHGAMRSDATRQASRPRSHGPAAYLGQSPTTTLSGPDNGKMYCSELVWASYLAPKTARRLFTARPMNFRAADGTLPQFWTELFAPSRAKQIPEGVPGTNPNDMARESILECAGRYY